MALVTEGGTVATTAPAGGIPPAPASSSPAGELSVMEAMQNRLNGIGQVIDSMQARLQTIVAAPSARAEGKQPPAKLEGAAGLEALQREIQEQKAEAHAMMINASILSAMMQAGSPEHLARKTLDSMRAEGKYEVSKTGEVAVTSGDRTWKVTEFVSAIMLRDDWQGLIPAKPGAKPLPKGKGGVPETQGNIQPNENGAYSVSAVLGAAGK
jgi:hypothetical protein